MWLWYSEVGPLTPLGLYDHPDDTPGVGSIEVPSIGISRQLRRAQAFIESLDDLIPGSGRTLFKLLP